ncbi:MAG TPA: gephyrin-like molybdotransferase Glp [Euzebyales bacterium]|nr:gephyrin-like molybdotransferase Glp [Euzebyales bacterium]
MVSQPSGEAADDRVEVADRDAAAGDRATGADTGDHGRPSADHGGAPPVSDDAGAPPTSDDVGAPPASSGAPQVQAGHAPHDHHHGPASELVPLSDHLQGIIDAIRPLAPIQLSLLDASGCALAADVVAHSDIPPFDNSAMDGYAVVAEAVDGWLPISGEIAAGDDPTAVPAEPGTAVRIMTGAAVPAGANAIVPVEQVEEDEARIRVLRAPRPGAHIRAAGESVRRGETVLVAGTVLDAASIGMLAALGHSYVSVYPQPRIVVVSTGEELADPGTERAPGEIYDANSYVLTILARDTGAQTVRRMVPSDDRIRLRETIEELLPHADVLVTTGGVSAGRYDLVKVVLAELGDVRFTKVGMRPGMPQAFGFVEADPDRFIPCFGLPGNPVSAYVSFEVFVRPTIRRMQGRRDLSRPRISATLEAPLDSIVDKVEFTRVRLRRRDGEWQARPTGDQGSGILRSMVEADGLAEVPADRDHLDVGERVVVHLLRSV